MAQWGSSANPYRFAGAWGYRDDGDAGLLHVGARYYEPAVGRWTSADKWLGDLYRPLSLNRYLYCEDDPVNHVDPSGYNPAAAALGIAGGLAVADGPLPIGDIIAGGIVIGVGIGVGIKKLADIIDDAKEWGDARERQKEHKRRAREDKQVEKDWKQRLDDGDVRPGEKKPKMKHKQKDARNYY